MQATKMFRKFVTLFITVISLSIGGILVQAEDTTDVTVQLGWTFDYSSSPLFLAQANGYFADAGLNVTLSEGGFQDGVFVNSLDSLREGTSQFAATDSYRLLQARAAGEPLVAIATLTQRSPLAIISLSESGIRRPQDLVGKTVAITQGGSQTMFEELLSDQNINIDDVNIIPREGFGVDPLLSGEVDAMGGWIINEGLLVRDAGYEPNFILLSDYGLETYVSIYVTTEDMIENHPEIVEGFVEGFVKGLQAVVDDPDQAVEEVLAYNNTLDATDQYNRIQIFLPLINPVGGQLGMLDANIFAYDQEVLLTAGILEEPIEVENAFTLEFLNRIYGL